MNGTAPAYLEPYARISLPDQREVYNENNGASFAEVILRFVFGWNPNGESVRIRDPSIGRADFRGTLAGVRGPNGKLYDIQVSPNGVRYDES